MATQTLRRVALVNGIRIPFCRSNTAYSELSNLDMLSDTLQGLVNKLDLDGTRVDRVIAGAVTSHAKDWNLAREAVLSTTLSAQTPGITLQQACGTSLQSALLLAGQIATGEIDCAIAAGSDTTSDAPIVFKRKFARRLIRLGQARGLSQQFRVFKGFRLAELAPVAPGAGEPRTGLSMGAHCEIMARQWQISRAAQDELTLASHQHALAAYESGFYDDLVMSYQGVARDNNMRSDSSMEKLAKLRTAFDKGPGATLTAGNSTPLTDGAAAVFLASEDYVKSNKLPVLAWFGASETAAVDFVHGEGLLMAPTVAIARLLKRTGLTLQDFDFYEIHEAFAAQVLCTLKAWEDETYCRERLGAPAALGSIDRDKLNVNGSSLAYGHPFAATGARLMATLGQLLANQGSGRGLISICTAGGMGVSAILERDSAD